MGTYRLRVPASRVVYVPEAQGGLPPGPHVQYVRGTRTSLGRWVRTAYRGTPGYDKASQIAKKAHKEGTTLLQAGGPEGLGYYTEAEFAAWVRPDQMISPTPRK